MTKIIEIIYDSYSLTTRRLKSEFWAYLSFLRCFFTFLNASWSNYEKPRIFFEFIIINNKILRQ